MSITVLNYFDQTFVDQVNAQATLRAEAAEAAKISAESDFSTALNDASQPYAASAYDTSATTCPTDLDAIFSEAASTYGVSVSLLTSIARAESNFNTSAVSSAGAVGIMQLMPETAASLGVTNSYDPRENIMGGARLISQLLGKYNGNTALALAAYNAGSANVDKYGGIPPFTETQNYVQKVLSYMNANSSEDALQTISNFLASKNIGTDALNALASLLKLASSEETASSDNASGTSASDTQTPSITVTVVDGSNIVSGTANATDTTENI